MSIQSINIIIADLLSKYEQIRKKDGDKVFYTKIADYGKYLLDHEETQEVLIPLYEEAREDVKKYIDAATQYMEKWNILAKDLIDLAEKAGIKDDLTDPFKTSITKIKKYLGKIEISGYDKYIDEFHLPYQLLLNRFAAEGKQNFITSRHIEKDNNYCKLQVFYNDATNKWNSFKQQREIKVWWAHYQIERLTFGVYKLEDSNKYFSADNIIDQLYKSEFDQILANNSSTFVILNREKFNTWIQVLHEYILPRLEFLQEAISAESRSDKLIAKLQYFPSENILMYKTTRYSFIGKAKALIVFLDKNIGVPQRLKDIQEGCNPDIIAGKQFRSQKDLSDTFRYIKEKMNVKNREYFPIEKQGDSIIWVMK